jgi:hypothetical protein
LASACARDPTLRPKWVIVPNGIITERIVVGAFRRSIAKRVGIRVSRGGTKRVGLSVANRPSEQIITATRRFSAKRIGIFLEWPARCGNTRCQGCRTRRRRARAASFFAGQSIADRAEDRTEWRASATLGGY